MAYKDSEKRKKYFQEYQEKNKNKLSAKSTEWAKNNPERRKEIAKKYRENNPEKTRQYVLQRSGWTLEQYQKSYAEQEGKCAICEKWYDKLFADHNHKTGNRRKLLCLTCNTGLGHLQDSHYVLRKAAQYLEDQALIEKLSIELAALLCGLGWTQEMQYV